MKPKKVKDVLKMDDDSHAASIARAYFLDEEKKGQASTSGVEISQKVLKQYFVDESLVPELFDEISRERVRFIVDECAMILGGSRVTGAHWDAVATFLAGELGEFREIKEGYAAAERKLVLVSQRLNEAMDPVDGQVSRTRVMACTMIFGETEMRRDHLKARTLMIIDELAKRIISYLGHRGDADELEIRLRGVLGNL